MKKEIYKILKSETKYKGKVLHLVVDRIKFPDGREAERESILHFGAVGLVPITDKDEVILVRQYRHALKDYLLEIPAGKLSKGEDPLKCAERELQEEIGEKANKIVKLAEFFTSPGYSNEYFYLYLALDLEESKLKSEDIEEEFMEIVKIPMSEVFKKIDEGKICDGKTIAGLCLAKLYLDYLKKKSQEEDKSLSFQSLWFPFETEETEND